MCPTVRRSIVTSITLILIMLVLLFTRSSEYQSVGRNEQGNDNLR